MSRTVVTILVLIVAAVAGVMTFVLWDSASRVETSRATQAFLVDFNAAQQVGMNGAVDADELSQAYRVMLVDGDANLQANLLYLGATADFDLAVQERFNQASSVHPLPLPANGVVDEIESFFASDDFGREVLLTRSTAKSGWRADVTGVFDGELTLEQAKTLHAALTAVAERVRAGEFPSAAEAESAARSAVLIGAIRGMAPDASTSRPATQPELEAANDDG